MHVYVPDAGSGVWSRAKLRGGEAYVGGAERTVTVNGASQKVVLPEEAMMVDASANLANVEDLCALAHVHEASILEAIDDRTGAGKPYTAAGDVVLAVNPFKWLDGLYTRAQRKAHEAGTAKTAHAYAVSAAAARGAARGVDQSILVSGESGAGKTETVKLLLAHLADIAEHGESTRTIVSQVLRAGPLLESYGNAATLRNGNSSRFAKFVRVEFDRTAMSMEGSWCETALLEKTRIVERAAGERSFHVFYELAADAAAAAESAKAGGKKMGDRKYISANSASEAKKADASAKHARGKDDDTSRLEMISALETVCGLDGDSASALMATIGAVLALGDLEFAGDGAEDGGATVGQDGLRIAALMLRCDSAALQSGLTERDVRGTTVRLDASSACAARDALAKDLYSRVFDTIVDLSNAATRSDAEKRGKPVIIGMLDLFGFEFYGTSNGFEQLLINLANERLQQRFVADVLARAQRELMAEGVPWDSVEFDDNADVLRLLEGRAGLVDILNEECVRGNSGSDANFVDKLLAFHKGHASLSTPRVRAHAAGDAAFFRISHYAGAVLYAPCGWVERNRDVLPTKLEQAMLKAHDAGGAKFTAPGIFASRQNVAGKTDGSPVKARVKRGRGSCLSASETVGSKFRLQLRLLMRDIAATKCRYVRCIRPNDQAIPIGRAGAFDRTAVVEQLRCCGVLSALKVARAGYPDREALPTFVMRYAVCARIFARGKGGKGATTPSTMLEACRGGAALDVEDAAEEDDDLLVAAHRSNGDGDDSTTLLDPAVVRSCAPYRVAAAALVEGLEQHARKAPGRSSAASAIAGRVFVGRTKVFLRDGALDELEKLRNAACYECVTVIQKRVRERRHRLKFEKIVRMIIRIEAFGRMVVAGAFMRRRAKELRAARAISSLWRGALLRKRGELKKGRAGAVQIQAKLFRPTLARLAVARKRAQAQKGKQLDDIQGRLLALAAPAPEKTRAVFTRAPSAANAAQAADLARADVERARAEAAETVSAARAIATDAEAALAELRRENAALRDRCAAAEARAESWRVTAARCKQREAQLVAIVDEAKREAREAKKAAKRERSLGAVLRDDGESSSYTRLRHAMLRVDSRVTPALRRRLLEARKPDKKVTVTQNELRDFREGLVHRGLDVLKHSTSGTAAKRRLRLTEAGTSLYWENPNGASSRSRRELFVLSECIEVRAAHDVDPESKDKLVCGTKVLRRSMDSKLSQCAFSFVYARRTIDVQFSSGEDAKLALRYCRALVREAKSKMLKSILTEDDTQLEDRPSATPGKTPATPSKLNFWGKKA
ncbi:P-loop containing nucleoside triphosphate hydrolase protein [Pelagophyceae sp. CCMP2097]|nr:P-loop containing nucleoside triphosphate hydrolase protein [Pelagophyceae sp. CCMP2097]|mmetsp:Transcript_18343/g.63149  ORF Transcript_18343/g.63149 Transcript_18343/m.63149 type:complete len:1304 (-) Transcript_18343:242-4153(-)